MLSAIYKGNVEAYKDGQNPILHLTSSFEAVEEAGLPLCFNDGHAEMAISDFFADTDRLDKVDWDIIKATYWADTVEDNDRPRLAEFLRHAFFPWELVSLIGVINKCDRG